MIFIIHVFHVNNFLLYKLSILLLHNNIILYYIFELKHIFRNYSFFK